jgi:hypothetical protein
MKTEDVKLFKGIKKFRVNDRMDIKVNAIKILDKNSLDFLNDKSSFEKIVE